MTEPHYKSDEDPNFIAAARLSIVSLEESIVWCDHLLARCARDASYQALIYQIIDPDYERKQAGTYLGIVHNAIDALEHPERSTPQERHDARAHITMIYTWGQNWENGAKLRDGMSISSSWEFAPSLTGVKNYYAPSQIAEIVVGQNDLTPGLPDRFADNR